MKTKRYTIDDGVYESVPVDRRTDMNYVGRDVRDWVAPVDGHEGERLRSLVARAKVLIAELSRVEQDLFDASVENHVYITGVHRRAARRNG